MDYRIFIIFIGITISSAQVTENTFKVIRKVYDQCSNNNDAVKCWKIQALKAVDRALHWNTVKITEGINIISTGRQGRSLFRKPLNDSQLDKMKAEEIDELLLDKTARFMDEHTVEVKIPKLVEEARKKKGGGGNGALLWALAIKGSFLAMAYKGIAVMSGTALIVGKLALLLAAILGLKKLVQGGGEKTTFEIVKIPKHTESHSYSSSYEDEGHYRSFNVDPNNNPYRAHIPTN